MTLKEFFTKFEHNKSQMDDMSVYFHVVSKTGETIHMGYSIDFGFDENGKFTQASKHIVNRLDDEINCFTIEPEYTVINELKKDCALGIAISIELK